MSDFGEEYIARVRHITNDLERFNRWLELNGHKCRRPQHLPMLVGGNLDIWLRRMIEIEETSRREMTGQTASSMG